MRSAFSISGWDPSKGVFGSSEPSACIAHKSLEIFERCRLLELERRTSFDPCMVIPTN